MPAQNPDDIREGVLRRMERHATIASVRALRRGRGAVVDLDSVADVVVADAEEPAFDAALVAALPGLIADLPPACGIVVRLRYLEQLSVAEVAEALDVPAGTVKSRAAYGVTLLRKRLAPVPR